MSGSSARSRGNKGYRGGGVSLSSSSGGYRGGNSRSGTRTKSNGGSGRGQGNNDLWGQVSHFVPDAQKNKVKSDLKKFDIRDLSTFESYFDDPDRFAKTRETKDSSDWILSKATKKGRNDAKKKNKDNRASDRSRGQQSRAPRNPRASERSVANGGSRGGGRGANAANGVHKSQRASKVEMKDETKSDAPPRGGGPVPRAIVPPPVMGAWSGGSNPIIEKQKKSNIKKQVTKSPKQVLASAGQRITQVALNDLPPPAKTGRVKSNGKVRQAQVSARKPVEQQDTRQKPQAAAAQPGTVSGQQQVNAAKGSQRRQQRGPRQGANAPASEVPADAQQHNPKKKTNGKQSKEKHGKPAKSGKQAASRKVSEPHQAVAPSAPSVKASTAPVPSANAAIPDSPQKVNYGKYQESMEDVPQISFGWEDPTTAEKNVTEPPKEGAITCADFESQYQDGTNSTQNAVANIEPKRPDASVVPPASAGGAMERNDAPAIQATQEDVAAPSRVAEQVNPGNGIVNPEGGGRDPTVGRQQVQHNSNRGAYSRGNPDRSSRQKGNRGRHGYGNAPRHMHQQFGNMPMYMSQSQYPMVAHGEGMPLNAAMPYPANMAYGMMAMHMPPSGPPDSTQNGSSASGGNTQSNSNGTARGASGRTAPPGMNTKTNAYNSSHSASSSSSTNSAVSSQQGQQQYQTQGQMLPPGMQNLQYNPAMAAQMAASGYPYHGAGMYQSYGMYPQQGFTQYNPRSGYPQPPASDPSHGMYGPNMMQMNPGAPGVYAYNDQYHMHVQAQAQAAQHQHQPRSDGANGRRGPGSHGKPGGHPEQHQRRRQNKGRKNGNDGGHMHVQQTMLMHGAGFADNGSRGQEWTQQ